MTTPATVQRTAQAPEAQELLQAARQNLVENHIRATVSELPTIDATPNLHGKCVVYIDDSRDYITDMNPALTVATGGKGRLVWQTLLLADDSVTQPDITARAVQAILSKNPDIVLIDFQMHELTGVEVIEALHRKTPGLVCIGFSSIIETNRLLEAAGAVGSVLKAPGEEFRAIRELNELVGRL